MPLQERSQQRRASVAAAARVACKLHMLVEHLQEGCAPVGAIAGERQQPHLLRQPDLQKGCYNCASMDAPAGHGRTCQPRLLLEQGLQVG